MCVVERGLEASSVCGIEVGISVHTRLRDDEHKSRSSIGLDLDPDLIAMSFDDGPRDVQPQAHACATAATAFPVLTKQLGALGVGDTGAAVAHTHEHIRAHSFALHLDVAPRWV